MLSTPQLLARLKTANSHGKWQSAIEEIDVLKWKPDSGDRLHELIDTLTDMHACRVPIPGNKRQEQVWVLLAELRRSLL